MNSKQANSIATWISSTVSSLRTRFFYISSPLQKNSIRIRWSLRKIATRLGGSFMEHSLKFIHCKSCVRTNSSFMIFIVKKPSWRSLTIFYCILMDDQWRNGRSLRSAQSCLLVTMQLWLPRIYALDTFDGWRWCIERHFMAWNSKKYSHLDGEAGTWMHCALVNSKLPCIVDATGTSRICMKNIEKMSMVMVECINFLHIWTGTLDGDKLRECNRMQCVIRISYCLRSYGLLHIYASTNTNWNFTSFCVNWKLIWLQFDRKLWL